jgi:heme/copper-type cytochrome/quinol oxidase subunit 3
MAITKRLSNYVLVALNTIILIDSTTFVLITYAEGKSKTTWMRIALSINTSADELAHCAICYAYLKVIIELNALLDKQIHLDNSDKLSQI